MKKAIILILLFLAGCQQQILTWQPTPEEWTAMTPGQRNEWMANEMNARRSRDEAWRRYLQGFQQNKRPQREVIIMPGNNSGVIDISSPSAYDYSIGRW